jgi:hypothetical protein
MHFLTRLVDVLKDPDICCGDPLYSLDEIKAKAVKVIDFGDSYLALDTALSFDDNDEQNLYDCSLDFCFFNKVSSNIDGSNVRVTVIFCGNGPTGTLRELRHIYWGAKQSGYTFYLPLDDTIKALNELKAYFDV